MNEKLRHPSPHSRAFTLIELMVVIAIIAIIAAIAIPGLLQSQRASNERNASSSLKTVATAEVDFRANDRDGNRVNDYWSYDISGLFCLIPAGMPVDQGSCLRLIEVSIATADGFGSAANVPFASGGTEVAVTSFLNPAPKAGYWYQALVSDLSPQTGAVVYAQSTDGGASCHNNTQFGLCAYPDSIVAGRQIFAINEGNAMVKRLILADIKGSGTNPPRAFMKSSSVAGGSTSDPNHWPTEANQQSFYGRMD